MPHWNDAPTGQVPAVLDRGNGDEQALAPPTWREEDTDWAAHEELFEPSMLSDELPAVGSMMNNNNDLVDMERQPWRFDAIDLPDDDTLVIVETEPPSPSRFPSGWRRRRAYGHGDGCPRGDGLGSELVRRGRHPAGAAGPPATAGPRAADEPPERRGTEHQHGRDDRDATCSSPGARGWCSG